MREANLLKEHKSPEVLALVEKLDNIVLEVRDLSDDPEKNAKKIIKLFI